MLIAALLPLALLLAPAAAAAGVEQAFRNAGVQRALDLTGGAVVRSRVSVAVEALTPAQHYFLCVPPGAAHLAVTQDGGAPLPLQHMGPDAAQWVLPRFPDSPTRAHSPRSMP